MSASLSHSVIVEDGTLTVGMPQGEGLMRKIGRGQVGRVGRCHLNDRRFVVESAAFRSSFNEGGLAVEDVRRTVRQQRQWRCGCGNMQVEDMEAGPTTCLGKIRCRATAWWWAGGGLGVGWGASHGRRDVHDTMASSLNPHQCRQCGACDLCTGLALLLLRCRPAVRRR